MVLRSGMLSFDEDGNKLRCGLEGTVLFARLNADRDMEQ